jgi:outer membrane protein OmpA-like peptidoglycan-associated protein
LLAVSAAVKAKVLQNRHGRLYAVAELPLKISLKEPDSEEIPAELLVGFKGQMKNGLGFMTGVGMGLTGGMGAPETRAFAGLSWTWDLGFLKGKPVKQKVRQTKKSKLQKPKPVSKPQKPVSKPQPKPVTEKIWEEVGEDKVLFSFNKHVPYQKGIKKIERIYNRLKEDKTLRIHISGHTCSLGKQQNNLSLSKRRAEFVRIYLMSRGIDSKRISIGWYGDQFPSKSNKTKSGRKNNRRVNIFLSKLQESPVRGIK